MDLFQVLLNIHDFKDDETIYAIEPWTLESEAQVILEPAEGVIHIQSGHFIFEYFLEVNLVKNILQKNQSSNLCMREQCLHVIEYALNNA